MKIPILSTGPGWVAIDKPSGLSVHNDPHGKSDALSLVLEQLWLDPDLAAATRWNRSFAPAPVHRLDRETSGVLLFATQKETATALAQAFESRQTQKTYRAIVRGRIEAAGEWTWPLSDRAEGRSSPQGASAARKNCRTEFRTIRVGEHLTELELDLITGRQHQIRRHAVLARHEVVGDKRYGDPRYLKRIESLFGVNRLLLHAYRLEAPLGSSMISCSAAVPPEFDAAFEPPRSRDQHD